MSLKSECDARLSEEVILVKLRYDRLPLFGTQSITIHRSSAFFLVLPPPHFWMLMKSSDYFIIVSFHTMRIGSINRGRVN